MSLDALYFLPPGVLACGANEGKIKPKEFRRAVKIEEFKRRTKAEMEAEPDDPPGQVPHHEPKNGGRAERCQFRCQLCRIAACPGAVCEWAANGLLQRKTPILHRGYLANLFSEAVGCRFESRRRCCTKTLLNAAFHSEGSAPGLRLWIGWHVVDIDLAIMRDVGGAMSRAGLRAWTPGVDDGQSDGDQRVGQLPMIRFEKRKDSRVPHAFAGLFFLVQSLRIQAADKLENPAHF